MKRGLRRPPPLFLAIFVLGAAVRAVDVPRPADGRVREAWRECDYAAIARNFAREGMDILRPRVDWRGAGPGFAEMELPAVPWAMAALYKVFGVREVLGRILLYAVSLAALFLFFALARRLLPPPGAAAAALFFALSPLAVRVSNSLQPEGPMLTLLLLAVLAFLRWLDDGHGADFLLSAAAASGAVLVKASAAHIGLLFLGLLVGRQGLRALRRPAVWAFGILALLPAALWYLHARGLYVEFGLSLGLSNEAHWFGPDLLLAPAVLLRHLRGILAIEILHVWTPLGLVLGIGALIREVRLRHAKEDGKGPRSDDIVLFWLLAVALFYLAAIRTTGDSWAAYYHIAAVPPAALAIGLAAAGILRLRDSTKNRGLAAVLSVALASVFFLQAFLVAKDFRPRSHLSLYACAGLFRPLIPEGALVLVSGGPSRDETGRPVAYNASYFFYWLDRKGWNLPSDGQTVFTVRAYAGRGAQFFVAERAALAAAPGFESDLRKAFPALRDCGEALLFDLR